MPRSSLRFVSILAPTFVACTPRASVPPAAAARAPDTPPITIPYRVLRGGEPSGVLLAGRADLDGHHAVRISTEGTRTGEQEELLLFLRPRDDGSLLAEVNYDERTAEGTKIRWSPMLRIVPKSDARAEVHGSNWERTIELTAE